MRLCGRLIFHGFWEGIIFFFLKWCMISLNYERLPRYWRYLIKNKLNGEEKTYHSNFLYSPLIGFF